MTRKDNDNQQTDRSIEVRGASTGSAVISGDGNTVTINNHFPPLPESNNSRTIALLSAEIDEVSALASEEFSAKLLQIHEKYRKGRVRDALDELYAIRQGEWWNRLNAEVQAKVLRNIARYGFERLCCTNIDPLL